MKNLFIDTSSFVSSVCIEEDGKIIAENNINYIRNHSTILMPTIENMLATLNISLGDIDKIAVAVGPGSFTGGRIGASVAMGLAKAGSCKLVPINSLDILWCNVRHMDCIIVPIIDARRSEVYFACYDDEQIEPYNIKHIDYVLNLAEIIQKDRNKKIVFVGDGAVLHKDKIKKYNDNFDIADSNLLYQQAKSMVHIINDIEPVKYNELKLFYIKKAQAEREYNLKSLSINKFDKAHLNDVVQIENDSMKNPWTIKMFEEELGNESAIYYVAVIDNKVVGYIGSRYVIDQCEITNIAVHSKYRQQGIGEMLLNKIIEHYKQLECKGITLEVRKSNKKAINLYNKIGLHSEGIRKNYYPDGEDANIMWLYF